ncbi:asparagine synthase-related protein [Streptomyces sp. NPDC020845]|uniref:asparagine synthase-related protein n=1 Tax=Streptomyces sp. NPDC020845 TaxID=3365096 RepID=UPI0037947EA2
MAAELSPDPHRRMITHASGRPWIVGRWSDGDLTSASAGGDKVVLLGRTTLSTTELSGYIRRARTVGDLDPLARSLPGCVHLIASVGGHVRVQGTLATVRQVFHGLVGGVTVAAARPQSLAALTGSGIDEESLALQLLSPGAPWPLSDECPWQRIAALTTGHYLHIRGDGTARPVRWWTPPEPDRPLASGADVLRQALTTAVRARTSRQGTVSADLSGGMDSTSLCFLAASQRARLVTYHHRPLDPSNDDRAWAARCESELPDARHVTESPDEAPPWYTGALTASTDLEGPYPLIRTRAKLEHLARAMSEQGSTCHLQGIGGDELFHARAASVHALARTHPLRSIRPARVIKSMHRWSAATLLRYLASESSYPAWLAGCVNRLPGGGPSSAAPRAAPGPDWEVTPAMPPWATADAVEAVHRRIRAAASLGPDPLAPLPVHHEMLRAAQVCGTMTRRASRVTEESGVSYEAPFLDDRVIEATMAIRLEDRIAAGRYKPVLTAAMSGIVPGHTLGRGTKGDYSEELYTGLRHNRAELLGLCEDSRLVRLGLVDGTALRSLLTGLHADTRPFMAFDPTLACESWLRSLSASSVPTATLTTARRHP